MQGAIWWKNEIKEERLNAKIAPMSKYLIKTGKKCQCVSSNGKSCYAKSDSYHERKHQQFYGVLWCHQWQWKQITRTYTTRMPLITILIMINLVTTRQIKYITTPRLLATTAVMETENNLHCPFRNICMIYM